MSVVGRGGQADGHLRVELLEFNTWEVAGNSTNSQHLAGVT